MIYLYILTKHKPFCLFYRLRRCRRCWQRCRHSYTRVPESTEELLIKCNIH